MATYLEGVEDGRRDILVRIEREAVAVFRDWLTTQHPSVLDTFQRNQLSAYEGLIKHLDPRPQSIATIHDRIESEALRQIEDERAAAAKAVGS